MKKYFPIAMQRKINEELSLINICDSYFEICDGRKCVAK